MRTISRCLCLGLVTATLGCGGVWTKADATEEFHQTYPLSADGRVKLENVSGHIAITGWDRDEVKLDAVKRANSQADLDAVKIEVDAGADRIAIHTKYPESKFWKKNNSTSVDYTLRVPRRARLERIANVNGAISVADVAGDLQASTVNGGVDIAGAGGNVKASSVNGKVAAAFSAVAAGRSIALETVNGGVVVTLPADANAEVSASSVNGGVSSELPLTMKSGVSSKGTLKGTLGSGGARIKASAVNGGVKIRQAGTAK